MQNAARESVLPAIQASRSKVVELDGRVYFLLFKYKIFSHKSDHITSSVLVHKMAQNKPGRKATKRKQAPDNTPDLSDLDHSVDELQSPEPPAKSPNKLVQEQININSAAEMLKEMKSTMVALKQTQSAVSSQLTDFGLRIEQGSTTDYTWRKPGLQKQHSIAVNVLKHVMSAKTVSEHSNHQKSTEHMQSAISLLQHRIKCIKIADSSPAGWDTVNEYVSSPLANNEEDDRRLRRAEKIAMDRHKDRQDNKRFSQRGGGYAGRGRGYFYSCSDRPDSSPDRDSGRPTYRSFGNN